VFRANIPPTFPFFVGVDPRVVDAAALAALFDPALVDKRDVLAGPYSPGAGFTGGTRVGVYLDTEEEEHRRTKAFTMDLLHRGAPVWAAELRRGVDDMLTGLEKGENRPTGFVVPLQRCLFRFLCKALVGADTAADPFVDGNGFWILDAWLALQLLPTQKVGLVPQPLQELLLHSFPPPSFLVSPLYGKLYRFVEEHGANAISVGEKEYGLSRKDAINNVLGFNAYGGFSVFLPSLLAEVGRPGDPATPPGRNQAGCAG
jgi:hydroperoxide lyase